MGTRRTAEEANCKWCNKIYIRTPTQKKKGRVYCSWDCYLKDRAKKDEEKKKNFVCANDGCTNTNPGARGLCNRCYQRWTKAFGKKDTWTEVTCQRCGNVFPTIPSEAHKRKFCSHKCYMHSDAYWKSRRDYAAKMAEARIKGECLQCGGTLSLSAHQTKQQLYADGRKRSPKRFCNKRCWRLYFVARFDRAVAKHSALQLPCSYDEFLTQEQLPCLIDGCDWVGLNLGIHTNQVHGLTVDELKALAGFNRKTSLVAVGTKKRLEKAQAERNHDSLRWPEDYDPKWKPRPGWVMRPEGKEHLLKARGLWCEDQDKADEG